MSRQTQADKQKTHWYRPSSIAALTLPKTPWSTDHSVYYQRHQSPRQSHVRAPEKTDHHDDNMQITHIGIIMITLTRTPMTRINLCSKHTEIHFIYAKFVPMKLMSHYLEILRNTRWHNCALSKTLIKIQITLLFKALSASSSRTQPTCRTSTIPTLSPRAVWRKFNNGEGTEQKRQKKKPRILMKRKFVIDK